MHYFSLKVKAVDNHFSSIPKSSIRKCSRELNIPTSTIHVCLKKKLKFKPYRYTKVQTLSDTHKQKRKQACDWFIEQGPAFPKNVIFSDEKWFVLKPTPNRKNNVHWAKSNPHIVTEVGDQGTKKCMVWMGILNGEILPITWFVGKGVNSENYLEMLRDKVWPAISDHPNLRDIYFMQDGARPHTTDDVLSFLNEKFHNRVISDKLDLFWPPKSPDLNLCDTFLWPYLEQLVFQENPSSVEELKEVVERFAKEIPKDMLLRATDNFFKRVLACAEEDGGHFETKM